MDICGHNAVKKPASLVKFSWIATSLPPASLGDARDDDLHAWILQVEVVQVLLHRCNETDASEILQVIPSAVDQEDILCLSYSGRVVEEGEKDVVEKEYNNSAVTCSLYGGFTMLLMILSSYFLDFTPILGKVLWYIAIVLHSIHIVVFTVKHVIKEFKIVLQLEK